MSKLNVLNLTTEYAENPLGMGEAQPRLSWTLEPSMRGQIQTAYQVLVASSLGLLNANTGDLWDSGQVASDTSTLATYAGAPLTSGLRAYWKVRVWDGAGEVSDWSARAWWEMGLLEPLQGAWIGGPPVSTEGSQPSPFLRRTLTLRRGVIRARLYVTALGLFEAYLNGQRVGTDVFVPGWTDYRKRIETLTYDVTGLLREGNNALGAILGDGWACGYLVWENHNRLYSTQPLLLAQLVVDYDDGTRKTVVTDGAWKVTTGPISASDIYHGETYDARLELGAWAEAGYDDGSWGPAHAFPAPSGQLVAKRMPPVRAVQEFTPLTVTEPVLGRYVFDLGQNMVGWVRLRVQGKAGTEVTLRFAERLNADGTLYTEALRAAKATDTYTLKGGGEEVFEPHFTFHGFQYVEVTGYPGTPTLGSVTGVVLHTDIPQTGHFECSDPRVNWLQQNILWGQKGNFLEVPTDCPQRDERLGWTGDAQVFIRTSAFNMNVAPFFTKWLYDLSDAQDEGGAYPNVAPKVAPGEGVAAWGDAGVLCPWAIYLHYGDTRVLERHYQGMTRWMDYLERTSDRLIRPDMGFGDWLAPNAKTPEDAPTPRDLIGTAYFAHDARLMARIAGILDKPEDAARFGALAEAVAAAFNREYVTPGGRVLGHTQTGYLLALAFDLLPEEKRAAALGHLVANIERRGHRLTTGFVGTPLLAPTLSRFGRTDVAYKLLLQDAYPSWLFTVKQGATTMWERWDGWTAEGGFQTPSMNSFNHYAYGSIGEWLYATVAGLKVDEGQPGFKHILIRPEPGDGLTSAKAELESPYGRVVGDWEIVEGSFTLRVTVPPNTAAVVSLPTLEPSSVTESGRSLEGAPHAELLGVEDSTTRISIGSGTYIFACHYSEPNTLAEEA